MSGGSAGGVVGAISINNISTVKVCMTKYNYGYPYLARKERCLSLAPPSCLEDLAT